MMLRSSRCYTERIPMQMTMSDGSTFAYERQVERDCNQTNCPWSASYVRPPPKTPSPEPAKTNGEGSKK